MMEVSLESAASEKQRTASQVRRSRKKASAHSVAAAANRSAWASELCAKKTGYAAVSATVAIAMDGFFETASAIRQTAARASAATAHMAARVTKGEKLKTFQRAAR